MGKEFAKGDGHSGTDAVSGTYGIHSLLDLSLFLLLFSMPCNRIMSGQEIGAEMEAESQAKDFAGLGFLRRDPAALPGPPGRLAEALSCPSLFVADIGARLRYPRGVTSM